MKAAEKAAEKAVEKAAKKSATPRGASKTEPAVASDEKSTEVSSTDGKSTDGPTGVDAAVDLNEQEQEADTEADGPRAVEGGPTQAKPAIDLS